MEGEQAPRRAGRADLWFKTLGAIVLGWLVLDRVVAIVRDYADVAGILIGGLLVAYLVFPVVAWLNARLPLWAALTIVYGCALAGLVAAAVLIIPPAVLQIRDLVAALPAFERAIADHLLHPHNPLVAALPLTVREYLAKLPTDLNQYVARDTASATSTITTALLSIAGIAALVVAVPVVSIYMLAESTEVKRWFTRLFPRRYHETAVGVINEIDAVVGGFVRGQLIVAAAVAVLATTALVVLRVPYALAIGIWAGFADIVPYVGPFAGGIPAALVAYGFNGPWNALWVVAAFTAINQIEAHLLAPRIVARTVRVTPLAVIFALLIGVHALGFLGLLIAVPIAGVIRVVVDRLVPRPPPPDAVIAPALTPEPRATHRPAPAARTGRERT